jgi:pimeloyl-ACP methyl ester carboxylesterase
MSVLRTPDERFANLPSYPFTPNYVQVETKGIPALRMHYVDAGPADAPTVVLVHGQPTWSFLYRDVIHVLSDAGLRVIAPDHIGFGRSDKLTERTDYTFARHIDWFHGLITGLDLQEVTLVVQDWGGPIGLSVLARDPTASPGSSRPTPSCTRATRRSPVLSPGHTTASATAESCCRKPSLTTCRSTSGRRISCRVSS